MFEPVWRILADSTAVARQVFSPNHSEGGCCNLHKKTFWTTQEAVGTALDSSFATECIQHSKCIQAARVLERQTAKTRGLTPVQDEKNRKIQHLKNSLFITAKWVHGPLRTPPRRSTAPHPTPPHPAGAPPRPGGVTCCRARPRPGRCACAARVCIGTKRRSSACPATVAPNGAGRWPGPRADPRLGPRAAAGKR